MLSAQKFALIGTGLVSATLLALGSPGFAAGEPTEPVVKKTIIIRQHDGAGKVESEREIAIANCPEGSRRFSTETEGKGEDGQPHKSRVVICANGNISDADMAKRLSEARDRLAKDLDAASSARAQALAELDKEIARLNGTHKSFAKE